MLSKLFEDIGEYGIGDHNGSLEGFRKDKGRHVGKERDSTMGITAWKM